MPDFTVYARREPTTDSATKEMYKAQGTPSEPLPDDVVIYHDAQATRFYARIPWYSSSKPDRRHKYQMLNCFRYHLRWID